VARIPDCACLDVLILGPKRNLDHRSFFCFIRYVEDVIQIISFYEQGSFKVKRETVIGIVLCYSHHVTFFTICPKLPVTMVTMAFTCTFPYVFIFVVSDLKKNIDGSTDLAGKRH